MPGEQGPIPLWLIDEGTHGHRVQSEGVVAALEAVIGRVAITRVPVAERIPGALRPAARAVFGLWPRAGSVALARRFSRFELPARALPRLIVSSGGRTAFASAALARRTGAPNVFVGDPAPFPTGWFAATLTPAPLHVPGNIPTGFVPTTMTPGRCIEAAAARWPEGPPARTWALLVGGASRSHRWTPADLAALAQGANALAARHGIRWLVTTSRRTGAEGDRALREGLDPAALAELVLFSERPEPVVTAYLGAAERVFVTQDSLTMLSEAVASGRPTVALAPAETVLKPGGPVTALLEQLDATVQVERWPVGEMAGRTPPPVPASPYDDGARALDAAVRILADRLGLGR